MAPEQRGQAMLAEMLEQPERLERSFPEAISAAAELRELLREANVVILLGRGSSRAACTFGAWALHQLARTPT